MTRTLTPLLLILLIQCALVITVYWPSATTDEVPSEQMAPFGRERVDKVIVGDKFDNETVLQKIGERWILPELEGLPADSAMVDKLLDALTGGNTGWPVADSVAARQRFQVASYHYRRRITLLEDDNVLGNFLLGTSPGYRKVYARNEAQGAIYSIAFNTHDAPGTSGTWLDRKLLQLRTPLRIDADGYSLQRQGDGWVSGIGKMPDDRELQALLSALRSLQIDGIASEDQQRDLAEAQASLALTVERLAGEVALELFRQQDRYFIISSEYPLAFTISAYDYDRLVNIDLSLISGEPTDR